MAEYENVKPGDLIVQHSFEAVVIGTPTPGCLDGGHLGLNKSCVAPGVLCYRRFERHEKGSFLTLNEDHWNRGAENWYIEQSQDPEKSRRLLEQAKEELVQGEVICAGTLGNSLDLEQALRDVENLLGYQPTV